mgnify:CR=1 FL=1|jgi:hypothetical protein
MFVGRNPHSYLNSWRDYIVFGRSATVFNVLDRVNWLLYQSFSVNSSLISSIEHAMISENGTQKSLSILNQHYELFINTAILPSQA